MRTSGTLGGSFMSIRRNKSLWACTRTCKRRNLFTFLKKSHFFLHSLNFCTLLIKIFFADMLTCVANFGSWRSSWLPWLALCVCRCLYLRMPSLISAFSIIEMQVLAATLLENFEFSLPPQTPETHITRKPLVLMVPMVEGSQYPWMGLKVRCLDE